MVSALALGAAACDDDGDGDEPTATLEKTPEAAAAEIPDVTIGAVDYSFDAPASIPGGLTRITLQNTGMEDHQALLFRLDESVTLDDFAAAPIETEADAEPFGTFAGGPIAGPGDEFNAVLDLEPGSYVLICPIPSPDGVPHSDKGMVATIEVTAPSAEQPAEPEADVTVTLSEFAFDAPDALPAGETTFHVVNAGGQIHEMGMVKLDEGATLEEVLASLEAPEGPYTVVGALYGLEGGAEGWTAIDLTPGTYAIVCFVTDPESGQPHIALGMLDSFAVE
jgi:uncharacterized cupredoxin-like copper-binding protein